MTQFKRYLGDGVDFDYDGNRVILTNPSGRVYLKPQIVQTLTAALTSIKGELKRQKRKVPLERGL